MNVAAARKASIFRELVPADGKGVELDVAGEREAFSALAK